MLKIIVETPFCKRISTEWVKNSMILFTKLTFCSPDQRNEHITWFLFNGNDIDPWTDWPILSFGATQGKDNCGQSVGISSRTTCPSLLQNSEYIYFSMMCLNEFQPLLLSLFGTILSIAVVGHVVIHFVRKNSFSLYCHNTIQSGNKSL